MGVLRALSPHNQFFQFDECNVSKCGVREPQRVVPLWRALDGSEGASSADGIALKWRCSPQRGARRRRHLVARAVCSARLLRPNGAHWLPAATVVPAATCLQASPGCRANYRVWTAITPLRDKLRADRLLVICPICTGIESSYELEDSCVQSQLRVSSVNISAGANPK